MKYTPTPKQAALLAFIRSYMERSGGSAPTYTEMMAGTAETSKSGVHRLLMGLQDRGHIAMMKGRARSITLLEAGK